MVKSKRRRAEKASAAAEESATEDTGDGVVLLKKQRNEEKHPSTTADPSQADALGLSVKSTKKKKKTTAKDVKISLESDSINVEPETSSLNQLAMSDEKEEKKSMLKKKKRDSRISIDPIALTSEKADVLASTSLSKSISSQPLPTRQTYLDRLNACVEQNRVVVVEVLLIYYR